MNQVAMLWITVMTLGAVGVYFLVRWLNRLAVLIRLERAYESFRLQRQRLEEMVLQQASSTGKPRGLKWHRCQFVGEPLWLLEGTNRHVAALVPLTIQFEPAGDAEAWEGHPVHEPRHGVVILLFHQGDWTVAGRVLFNISAQQAASQLGPNWRPAPPLSTPSSLTSVHSS
ncbi:MAG: hypothetical protein NZ703_12635 [Gemmataceae bacterium]|nr:hypothetical protein [Gemmataceae bacterium]MCS7271918.1 hypothetical protein [Gemmataceae bacterium]MDW8243074.1 hypothetical protein [Thermogemmata sp.]